MPENNCVESGRAWLLGLTTVECVFVLDRRDISQRLEQAAVIEPVDPVQGREFDRFDRPPRGASPNDLGLEQSVDALRERSVVAISDASDGGAESNARPPCSPGPTVVDSQRVDGAADVSGP